MQNKQNRRAFIANTGKAAIATGISLSVLPAMAKSFVGFASNPFAQQPLPYEYKALEPIIDTMTMEIHYSKHAAAYAKNLAEACMAEKVATDHTAIEEVLHNISKYSGKMRNNCGGHYNHELFWQCMGPASGAKPEGTLAAAIDQSFGSFDAFKTQFTDAGKLRFGSGWAWLVINADKKLVIGSTPNQDNPLMDVSDLKGNPILGLDVWEHAYYLHYQNRRPDYINAFFNVINWSEVERRYLAA
jgi:Fe-Mn family superoxide dismutase